MSMVQIKVQSLAKLPNNFGSESWEAAIYWRNCYTWSCNRVYSSLYEGWLKTSETINSTYKFRGFMVRR